MEGEIRAALLGEDAGNTARVDAILCALDGTKDKARLGANAILAVSLACSGGGIPLRVPLYQFLGGVSADTLPMPMMNVLNGGAHADNGIDVQEFMLMPVGAQSFRRRALVRGSVSRVAPCAGGKGAAHGCGG